MSFRVPLDEDIHLEFAFALRRVNYDAIHIQEVGRKGKTDQEQLVHAISEQRAILTRNVRDFIQLHNDYCYRATEHYGIIVSKRLSLSSLFHAMDNLLTLKSQSSLRNTLLFI